MGHLGNNQPKAAVFLLFFAQFSPQDPSLPHIFQQQGRIRKISARMREVEKDSCNLLQMLVVLT
jgi:hypothetical protein